jgi:hypothetical protein
MGIPTNLSIMRTGSTLPLPMLYAAYSALVDDVSPQRFRC